MKNDSIPAVRIISPDSWGPELPLIDGAGSIREVIGPRIGAELRSFYRIDLADAAVLRPLRHPGEAVYYVISGEVSVESSCTAATVVPEGGLFHIRPYTDYTLTGAPAAELVGGPAPVDPSFGAPASEVPVPENADGERGVRFYHRSNPGLQVPFISADARLIVWYGEGAVEANMNYVVLRPGERNKEHLHRYSEDTIFILAGHGTAEDITNDTKFGFGPGDAVHIPAGVIHAIAANRGERVISAGGPCPADLDMLRAAGVDVDKLAAALGTP
jgi:quercetin dioxygenase-like cupin family protein